MAPALPYAEGVRLNYERVQVTSDAFSPELKNLSPGGALGQLKLRIGMRMFSTPESHGRAALTPAFNCAELLLTSSTK